VGNSAGKHSGGLYYGHYSRGTIANCIVWGNSAGGRTDEFAQVVPPRYGKLFINYNCIQGWTGTLGGTGNIGNDPCFVTLGYWDANAVWVEGDYHLQPSSSCINAGDPNYIAEPNETDLEGKPRVVNYRIDMGAYESPIFAEARILPQTINLASKGKWITAFIQLPEDYNVADIDPNSIFLEDEIQAESLRVDKQQQVAIAKFNRSEVRGILNVGEVELTITGQLADGTAFEATDTIKVIDKADKK